MLGDENQGFSGIFSGVFFCYFFFEIFCACRAEQFDCRRPGGYRSNFMAFQSRTFVREVHRRHRLKDTSYACKRAGRGTPRIFHVNT